MTGPWAGRERLIRGRLGLARGRGSGKHAVQQADRSARDPVASAEKGAGPAVSLCDRRGHVSHQPAPAHSASPSRKPRCPPQSHRRADAHGRGDLAPHSGHHCSIPDPQCALRIVPPWPPQGPDWTRVPVDLLTSQLAQGSTSQALACERLKFQKVCQEIHCF